MNASIAVGSSRALTPLEMIARGMAKPANPARARPPATSFFSLVKTETPPI